MLEVTDAVLSVWDAGRVGMHLAPRADSHDMGDSDLPATFGYVARELGKRGLAFLCSRESVKEPRLGPALKKAFGGVYIAKNMAFDANGKTLIGYGSIASDGQNRSIQEISFGTNTTLARDPKWGALNLMFQYSYIQRNPWLATAPGFANANMHEGFVNFRYTLPGAPPPAK